MKPSTNLAISASATTALPEECACRQPLPQLALKRQDASSSSSSPPSLVLGKEAFLFGAALKPGYQLGGYRLIAEMQRTATAVLWEARDVNLKRRVALRIFRRDATATKDGFEVFEKSARLAAKLEHPNIAQVYAVGRQGRAAFLAREWVHGMRVDHLLDKWSASGERPLPISLPFKDTFEGWAYGMTHVAIQLADALCLAHDSGVVHGAVWPGNIIVTPEGVAKWIDFGNGAPLIPAAINKMQPWLSPARNDWQEATPSDDVYGLGAVLYHSLVFEKPPVSENRLGLRRKTAIRMRSLKNEIPAELRRIVLRALEDDPLVRYKDVRELKDDLQSFLATGARQGRRKKCCAWVRTLLKRLELRFRRRFVRGAQAQMYVR
ncbi:MAG: serine/threonine protein kinase [Planctomycetes bacterium]|nr:serine/threonine protein kinase [Planctomycetota bacterium]